MRARGRPFCDIGKRAAARELLELRLLLRNVRLSPPLQVDRDLVFAECLDAVESFEQHPTIVAKVVRGLKGCVEIADSESTVIRLRSYLSVLFLVSRALMGWNYLKYNNQNSLDTKIQRQRRNFFIAVQSPRELQRIIRRAAVGT